MRSAPEAPYVIWILVSTVGLLQGLAARYGWLGLLFFRRNPRLGYVCAAVLIPLSYGWFFSMTNRNVPGLEGWQLFSRFGVGAAGGLLVVLIVSSVVNRAMAQHDVIASSDCGLDDLRQETYAGILHHLYARLVQGLREDLAGEETHG